MRFAKWKVHFPEESREGYTPDEIIRQRGSNAFGLMSIGEFIILGSMADDSDISGLEKYEFIEISKDEATQIILSKDPGATISESGEVFFSPYVKEQPMSVRFFSTSSIKTGVKGSDFWDGTTTLLTYDFDSIATATPSGSQSYTFSSIPQTYKHLQLSWLVYGGNADASITIRLNGNSGTYTTFRSFAGTAQTSYGLLYYPQDMNSSGSRPAVGITDFYDYTSSNYKTTKTMAGSMYSPSPGAGMTQFSWSNTAAINSITVYMNTGGDGNTFNGTFGSNTVLALYGIKG